MFARCSTGWLLSAALAAPLLGCEESSGDASPDASSPMSVPNANVPESDARDAGDTSMTSAPTSNAAPSSANVPAPGASDSSDPGKTGANFGLPDETQGSAAFSSDETATIPTATGSGVTLLPPSTSESSDETSSGPAVSSAAAIIDGGLSSDASSNPSTSTHTGDSETATEVSSGSSSTGADTSSPPTCPVCPPSADPCWVYACNPLSAQCDLVPNLGNECDDGDACTLSDTCGADGACGGSPLDCPASTDACSANVCNPDSGQCEPDPMPNTAECDDDDACTEGDKCDGAGSCVGKVVDCSGLNDQCLTGVCNPKSGTCDALPSHLGEPCHDPSVCTDDDRCQADGSCAGKPKDCSAYDASCVIGQCNAISGACEPQPLDGVTCDDETSCTANDICKQGVCTGIVPDTCSSLATIELENGAGALNLDTSCRGVGNQFNVSSFLTPVIGDLLEGGDCTQSTGPEVFVHLDLTGYVDEVRIEASTDSPLTLFDTVLILMGSDPASDTQCGYSKLAACNDDISLAKAQSRIDVAVAPGAYVLVVDGYLGPTQGPVGLTVKVTQQ